MGKHPLVLSNEFMAAGHRPALPSVYNYALFVGRVTKFDNRQARSLYRFLPK